MLKHDSHDPVYRLPLGPVRAGDRLTLRFYSDEGAPSVRLWDGADAVIPMENTDKENMYEITVTAPAKPVVMWYDFILKSGARYGNAPDLLGGEGAIITGEMHSYQVTVYDPLFETPEYLVKGNIYQIFPDRYYRGGYRPKESREGAHIHKRWTEKPLVSLDPDDGDNQALDFFLGSLDGIRQKLDYIKELGATVIYLNPIFRARSNHRYDTGDYMRIDPFLGDTDAFDRLTREAARRDMRILLDGVFSHTGSDSRYFNKFGRYEGVGAYQSKQSPYYPWYTFEEYPDKYKCWWDFHTLPTLDKSVASLRSFLLDEREGVLPHWIRHGACGWRLDVADELPVDLIAKMRDTVKRARPDAALLGEVWEDASNKYCYGQWRCYCLGDTLDSVMNYPLRTAILDFFCGRTDSDKLCRFIRHQREIYPAPLYYACMNLLGSHDRLRAVNALCGYRNDDGKIGDLGSFRLTKEQLALGKRRYIQAMRLLCALPGAPSVYYGDEIGMQGMRDPYCRAPMAWHSADAAMRGEVSKLLNERLQSPVLQTGDMRIAPDGKDAVIVTRYIERGVDALGARANNGEVTIRIER